MMSPTARKCTDAAWMGSAVAVGTGVGAAVASTVGTAVSTGAAAFLSSPPGTRMTSRMASTSSRATPPMSRRLSTPRFAFFPAGALPPAAEDFRRYILPQSGHW